MLAYSKGACVHLFTVLLVFELENRFSSSVQRMSVTILPAVPAERKGSEGRAPALSHASRTVSRTE